MAILASVQKSENILRSIFYFIKTQFAMPNTISVGYDDDIYDPDDTDASVVAPLSAWVDIFTIMEGAGRGGYHLIQCNVWTRTDTDPIRRTARQNMDKLCAIFSRDNQTSIALYDFTDPSNKTVIATERIVCMNNRGRLGAPNPDSIEPIDHPGNPEGVHGMRVDFQFRIGSDFSDNP